MNFSTDVELATKKFESEQKGMKLPQRRNSSPRPILSDDFNSTPFPNKRHIERERSPTYDDYTMKLIEV